MKWASEDQELINWFTTYVSSLKKTKNDMFYVNLLGEINEGPTSRRALSRELPNGLRLIKQLVELQRTQHTEKKRKQIFDELYHIINP